MRQTYLSPFTIVTPNIGERCGGGGRSRPWRRVCTQRSTGVPGDAAVCPPVCPGHLWGSWMLGDVGTCTPGDLSTVCARGGLVCVLRTGGTVCAQGPACAFTCVPGLRTRVCAVGDALVPLQWCQWCGWTRAASRVHGCHAMRRCEGRSPPTWRPPSFCPRASSGPPRAGVSAGGRGGAARSCGVGSAIGDPIGVGGLGISAWLWGWEGGRGVPACDTQEGISTSHPRPRCWARKGIAKHRWAAAAGDGGGGGGGG